MKNYLAIVIAGSFLVGLPVLAQSHMDDKTLSKYMGVISCVDRTFFDGGYTPGEEDREALMDALLSKVGLPKYDESLMGSKTKDSGSYMEGYSACDNNWNFLASEAKKVGISPEEGWD